MPIEDAQRFAEELATNKSLAETIKAKAAGLASLVELGRTNGFNFTMDELKQVIRGAAKRDLTDDQLEVIAGGQGGDSAVIQTTANAAANTSSNAVQVITVLDYTQIQVVSSTQSTVVTTVA